MSSKKNKKMHPWRKPFSSNELARQGVEDSLPVLMQDMDYLPVQKDWEIEQQFEQLYEQVRNEETS